MAKMWWLMVMVSGAFVLLQCDDGDTDADPPEGSIVVEASNRRWLFHDDSACIWDCASLAHEVPAEEEAFLQAIVNSFEHHPRLIWAVAEESSEAFSATRVSNIARVIREADDFDYPVAVHKLTGVSFDEFADDPNIDQLAMQLGERTPSTLHSDLVAAFEGANGRTV